VEESDKAFGRGGRECFKALSWREGPCGDGKEVIVEGDDGDNQLRFELSLSPTIL